MNLTSLQARNYAWIFTSGQVNVEKAYSDLAGPWLVNGEEVKREP